MMANRLAMRRQGFSENWAEFEKGPSPSRSGCEETSLIPLAFPVDHSASFLTARHSPNVRLQGVSIIYFPALEEHEPAAL